MMSYSWLAGRRAFQDASALDVSGWRGSREGYCPDVYKLSSMCIAACYGVCTGSHPVASAQDGSCVLGRSCSAWAYEGRMSWHGWRHTWYRAAVYNHMNGASLHVFNNSNRISFMRMTCPVWPWLCMRS